MKKIIFTICSNNYLAQAKVLGDSVLHHASEYTFVIILCDKMQSNIDYTPYKDFIIVEVADVPIPKFDDMLEKYNIIELNTSVKPFCFEYLYDKYNADIVMYFDPDTCIFSHLNYIEEQLKNYDIILTPHILIPIEFDGLCPDENIFTNHGIYNLGFLATKRSTVADDLFKWWQRRLEINCYIRTDQGIFVDQLPMNFTPLFFENVLVSKNMGLNVAPWNLHERPVATKQGKWLINDGASLIFYHFSNYKPNNPDVPAKYYDRVTFEGNDVLKSLYDWYREELIKNNYDELSKINCEYSEIPVPIIDDTQIRVEKKVATIKLIWKYFKTYPLFFLRKDFWRSI